MKRFITFSGDVYYASGGAKDLLSSFDVLAEAIQAGNDDFAGW